MGAAGHHITTMMTRSERRGFWLVQVPLVMAVVVVALLLLWG